MKRRYFLSISTLALTGLITRVRAENSPGVAKDTPANVKMYFELLDAGFMPEQDFSSALAASIAVGEESYKSTGYKPLANGVFTFSDQLVVRVVELSHPELGVLESGVLFFAKQASGDWKKYTSLSGFQVKAIVDQINKRESDLESEKLRHSWLPIENRSTKLAPNTYLTAAGQMIISTQIGDSYAITEIKRVASRFGLLSGLSFGSRTHQAAIKFNV